MTVHNTSSTRVRDPHVRLSERPRLPDLPEGRFGRLFPDLPCHIASGDALLRYGAAEDPLEYSRNLHGRLGEDNSRIPAGWPFFGQFIAHDITHDRSPLQETEDVATLQNFRKPRLDLECVYGAGPVGQPYLYDAHDPDKLLIGPSQSPTGDLPRNGQGLALVGDARNDTHLFISQLHLAFCTFTIASQTGCVARESDRIRYLIEPYNSYVGTISGSCSGSFFHLTWAMI